MNEKARLLRAKGEPVIHLGAGEPKNRAPIASILSAAGKLKEGDIKYTPTEGTSGLRKAIIRYTEENYEKLVAPENVLVSNGAKQALYNILFSILNPQDEVIILAPYWVSYPEMVKMCYGVPVIVTPEDGTFHPRMEDIKEVVGSYTKAIIVNSPNNPSGAIYSEEFIAELIDYCESKGIYYISDDIYHQLVFEGKRVPSPYKYTTRDIENSRVITINGVSKLYGMTGFRVGWSVAPRRLTEIMLNVQAQMTTTASLVVQAAAQGALTGVQSTVEALRQMLENNRNIMMNELEAFNDVHLIPPEELFTVFPTFAPTAMIPYPWRNRSWKKRWLSPCPEKNLAWRGTFGFLSAVLLKTSRKVSRESSGSLILNLPTNCSSAIKNW